LDLKAITEGLNVVGLVLGGTIGGLVVLLPGWVLATVYSRGVIGPPASDRSYLASLTLGGLLVHLVAFPATYLLAVHITSAGIAWGEIAEIEVWALGTLVLLPSLIGAGFGILSEQVDTIGNDQLRGLLQRLGVSEAVRTRDAWTWGLRSQQTEVFVRASLKGGSTVLGLFGQRSLASSDPAMRDIFLEEEWQADGGGWFDEPYENSRGIWISGDELVQLEFFIGTGGVTGG
jgi:hypothetical protein